MDQRARYVSSYTVLLFVVSALLLSACVVNVWLAETTHRDLRGILFLMTAFQVLIAVQACALAAGRACGARWAWPGTLAINLLLVMLFPLGTALAAWWFLAVRPLEKPAAPADPSAST